VCIVKFVFVLVFILTLCSSLPIILKHNHTYLNKLYKGLTMNPYVRTSLSLFDVVTKMI
jgi:hypothetical protein